MTLQGTFDDGTGGGGNLGGGVTCACGGGTPITATASTTVDVEGAYVELDSFTANQTRSNGWCCSTDTDYVVLSAEQEPSGQKTSAHSFGAINVKAGETHTPDSGPLVLGPFYALPDDSSVLVFNYSIVNSGHNPGDDILNAMAQAGLQAIGAAAGAGDGATAGDAASSQGLASLLGSFTSSSPPTATASSSPTSPCRSTAAYLPA